MIPIQATTKPRRMSRTDRITTVWMIVAVVTMGVGIATRGSMAQQYWTMIHVVTLGVLTNAILQWSWFFTRALLHLRRDDRHSGRDNAIRVVAFNVVFIGLIAGMWSAHAWLTVVCAGLIGAVIAWHGIALLIAARTPLASHYRTLTWYYATAAAFLVLGCVVAGFITVAMFEAGAPAWIVDARDELTLVHAIVNLGGWIGLTMAGTLVTLGPTMLRTRMDESAVPRARRALTWLALSLLAAATSAITGPLWLVGASLAGFTLALLLGIGVPLGRAALAKRPGSYATWTTMAGITFIVVALGAVAVNALRASDVSELRALNVPWLIVLGVGGMCQIFVAALTHLMPIVVGGGPAHVRLGMTTLETAWPARLAARCAALILLMGPFGDDLQLTWWGIVLATFIVDIALFALSGVRQGRAKRSSTPTTPDTTPGRGDAPTPATSPLRVAAPPLNATPASPVPERAPAPGPRPHPGVLGGPLARAVWALGGITAVLAITLIATLPHDSAAPSGSTTASVTPTGESTQVTLTVENMSYSPARIEVPVGNALVVTLHNTGDQRHDLVFANGARIEGVAPGASATVTVGVIAGDVEGWCSIAGHRQMGMTVQVVATGISDESSASPANGAEPGDAGDADDGNGGGGADDEGTAHGGAHAGHGGTATDAGQGGGATENSSSATMAELSRQAELSDAALAELPPLGSETYHRATFRVTESTQQVTAGLTRQIWTYNGQTPGPVLHGRVGDTFTITLINDGTMGHSIDFHAGEVAPNAPMATIEPGESLEYTFTAGRSGIWMYHCSTMPMSNHIANGMFGAVVIEPDDLPAADRTYVLVHGEQYLGGNGEPADASKVAAGIADVAAFNGRAFQYDAHPLAARVGERVRVWVLNAGPNSSLTFHVVGAQFDTVWREGVYSVRQGEAAGVEGTTGAQALPLLAAEGGFVEFVPKEAGDYPFVNHQMSLAEKGAHGIFAVTR
ncbi:multicopper oxidase domain-containing protein [Rarobacter faecitabidus]|uniref:Copper-containing nitrite reductase n=1 Tax=Rarobacter faecitabidus TaxID=13243 RepID=A0A542ZDT7_RARFA|nr:multicopper oxidase domain-containing protein [Rarobacter faecitabidus]TQL58478.1 nitrite reductase (NO-forming) [Rarobacter faecitabidus]